MNRGTRGSASGSVRAHTASCTYEASTGRIVNGRRFQEMAEHHHLELDRVLGAVRRLRGEEAAAAAPLERVEEVAIDRGRPERRVVRLPG